MAGGESGEIRLGNITCPSGHPLWLLPEGYAYCAFINLDIFRVWRLTEPRVGAWVEGTLRGTPIWASPYIAYKEDMLAFVEEDMAAHRQLMQGEVGIA